MIMNTSIDELTTEILKSKKYTSITSEVIQRICTEMMAKFTKKKDIVKAVKNQLHIINESFLFQDSHLAAQTLLESYSGNDIMENRDFSKKIMALHISTRERLAYIEEIYEFISKYVEPTTTVLDIGCGFNPFAIPFFKKPPRKYVAFEINNDTISLINRYFSKSGYKDYYSDILDAVAQAPVVDADVTFLFKLLPLLHQQKKGRPFTFLDELNTKFAIVSFPTKSLSGKERGMEEYYSEYLHNGLSSNWRIIDKAVFGNEIFFALQKSDTGKSC